ncbi:hypothetical protein [Paraburkholderia strydomiana]|uniref:hypothetical protein n=1 Tax=Paraburkholderia strydomiana TaxID=1245417 RepID=UPI002035ABEF|nr:hypothetical protein [Paraburkholderia strydomiana]
MSEGQPSGFFLATVRTLRHAPASTHQPHFILYGHENNLVGQPLENKEISSAMKFPTTRSPWSLYIGTGHVCDFAGMRIQIE